MIVLMSLDGTGTAWILTFGLFPQTWAILPRNKAAVTVILAVVGIGLVRMWQGPRTGDEFVGIAISTVIMLVLSLTLGLFIDRIISEADTRARSHRRAQAHPGRAGRRRAGPGRRRRARADLPRDPRHPRPGLHLGRHAGAGDRAGPRPRRPRGRPRAAAADRADRRRQPVGGPAHRRRDDPRPPAVAHPVGGAATTGRRRVGRERDDAARCGSRVSRCVLPANSEVVLLRTAQEAPVQRAPALGGHDLRGRRCPTRRRSGRAGGVRQRDRVRARREARGYGLDGATARAAEVGGRFDVDSAPGAGSRLRVEVPR